MEFPRFSASVAPTLCASLQCGHGAARSQLRLLSEQAWAGPKTPPAHVPSGLESPELLGYVGSFWLSRRQILWIKSYSITVPHGE